MLSYLFCSFITPGQVTETSISNQASQELRQHININSLIFSPRKIVCIASHFSFRSSLDVIMHHEFEMCGGRSQCFEKLVKGGSVMQSCGDEFFSPNREKELIKDMGTHAIAVVFGRKEYFDSLGSLNHNTLTIKIISSIL